MDGKLLRKLRKDAKMTQQQLANRLNVDLSSVGKWELHDVTPNEITLRDLTKIFNVSYDELMGASREVVKIEEKPYYTQLFESLSDEGQKVILGSLEMLYQIENGVPPSKEKFSIDKIRQKDL